MISCSIRGDGRVMVTFTDPDPTRIGQWVSVAGDFNDWNTRATPMRWGNGGHMATVVLPAARHRFRYWSSRRRYSRPSWTRRFRARFCRDLAAVARRRS